jgi:hypothetical protein
MRGAGTAAAANQPRTGSRQRCASAKSPPHWRCPASSCAAIPVLAGVGVGQQGLAVTDAACCNSASSSAGRYSSPPAPPLAARVQHGHAVGQPLALPHMLASRQLKLIQAGVAGNSCCSKRASASASCGQGRFRRPASPHRWPPAPPAVAGENPSAAHAQAIITPVFRAIRQHGPIRPDRCRHQRRCRPFWLACHEARRACKARSTDSCISPVACCRSSPRRAKPSNWPDNWMW